MRYEGIDRYQFQPWHIKAMRWIIWKPLYALLAIYWIVRGCRTQFPDCDISYWEIALSCADNRMGHYWTHEEMNALFSGAFDEEEPDSPPPEEPG